ncbi:MAG: hypothetical protein K0U98_00205 [Deltaproteobacteria bacterium]|nr:hypothetical protein [Deltaproteobacteria bacterium]
MLKMKLGTRWVLLAVFVVVAGLAMTATTDATCSGIKYTFYQSPACQVVVGSQIFNCPGYPFEDDAYMQTPFYTTQSVNCACGGGSGNPGEGDEDDPG